MAMQIANFITHLCMNRKKINSIQARFGRVEEKKNGRGNNTKMLFELLISENLFTLGYN